MDEDIWVDVIMTPGPDSTLCHLPEEMMKSKPILGFASNYKPKHRKES